MSAAVDLRNQSGRKSQVDLEASGGVTLETVRSIAQTGVERIAVGALTHSAPALDISLELD
jgi:nicotinate-nucleotide pyrophosphorylase (carboxylating)